ncbi:hypothetical protein [Rhodococcoides yunnanense]|uniref:hypothetical protein n=1 Tax=Rhodococcoides yunnanense TaxID=278209 RepID=UPI000932BFEA|nr:hypothetical protein [Rhodococcus yunnanensis]
MNRLRGLAEAMVLVVVAVSLCAVVGLVNPLPKPGVNTDSLGPDSGETVQDYLSRAEGSIAGSVDADDHWALVSFDAYVAPDRALSMVAGARVAQVVLRVPIERVQTRVITVGVPGTEASVVGAADVAATELNSSTGLWDRQSRIDSASVAQLAAGCECVVGLVVRATPTASVKIEQTPGIRAVEALPADARAGHFAVRALLPDYTDIVGPLPDDGDIPTP